MGGSGERPSVDDGVTACLPCNEAYEHALQREALRCGWKVRRWVREPSVVPVFEAWSGVWWVLDREGGRWQASSGQALRLTEAVYGIEEYAKWGVTA